MRKLPLKFIETSSFGSRRIALYKVVFSNDGFLSHILAGIDQVLSTFRIPASHSFDLITDSYHDLHELLLSASFSVTQCTEHDACRGFASAGSVRWSGHAQHPFGSISSVTGAPCLNTVDIALLFAVKEKTYVYTCTTNTPDMALASANLLRDAFLDTTSSLDFEYFSYGQDLTPFNALLVNNKILICNYIEYAADDIANQFQTTHLHGRSDHHQCKELGC
jgi:hypothetical protein